MFVLIDNYAELNRIYNVGIYVRLSREDDNSSQSESIQNQKDFLIKYVINNGWNLFDIYCDDGYSGTNFERPGFKKLIEDIELGKVNLIITKDLSRLGRDYIETGNYLERYFPEHRVRFIAVNDGIDTFQNNSNNDMSPFRSVMNDMYAKDISRKTRTVIDTKRMNGKFIGAFAPYGYKKSDEDKNRLIVDEEAAVTVKRIFNMYLGGYGYAKIADILNAEGVPNPGVYKKMKNIRYNNPRSKLHLWTHEVIKSILGNPTYAGHITQNKYSKINYKVKKLRALPKSKWITIKDTHEPIISQEEFELVQNIMEERLCIGSSGMHKEHLLTGLIYCGDCGERMTFTKTPRGKSYCICTKYKRFKMCTRHAIPEEDLENYVKGSLKKLAQYYVDNERLVKKARINSSQAKDELEEKELEKLKHRLAVIKNNIKSLYEDKLKGILTTEDFIELSKDYNKERETISIKIDQINSKILKLNEVKNESNRLLKLIKEFAGFENINRAIIMRLVYRIEVFEDKEILIHYKFKI